MMTTILLQVLLSLVATVFGTTLDYIERHARQEPRPVGLRPILLGWVLVVVLAQLPISLMIYSYGMYS